MTRNNSKDDDTCVQAVRKKMKAAAEQLSTTHIPDAPQTRDPPLTVRRKNYSPKRLAELRGWYYNPYSF